MQRAPVIQTPMLGIFLVQIAKALYSVQYSVLAILF